MEKEEQKKIKRIKIEKDDLYLTNKQRDIMFNELNKDLIYLIFGYIIDDIQYINDKEYSDSECSDGQVEDLYLYNYYAHIGAYKETIYFQVNRTDILENIKSIDSDFSYDKWLKVRKEMFNIFNIINKKKHKDKFFKTHFVAYIQALLNLNDYFDKKEHKIEIVMAIFYLVYLNRLCIYINYKNLYVTINSKLSELMIDNDLKNDYEKYVILRSYKESLSEKLLKKEICFK